jgi:probable rRNA maturation factor
LSLIVHVGREGVRVPVAAAELARVARKTLRSEGVQNAMLSIAFLSRRAIASINRKHLGKRGATDVIAFAMRQGGAAGPVVGDIYISPEVASANARRLGIPVRQEVARLVVHGTLHVLG